MSKGNGRPRRVFQATPEWRERRSRERPFEWVELDDGQSICVWATRVHEALLIAQGSTLPEAFGPEQRMDAQAAVMQMFMRTCRDDEPPDGQPVFSMETLWALHDLSMDEWERLTAAQARVNGTGAAERLVDFTNRTRAGAPPR